MRLSHQTEERSFQAAENRRQVTHAETVTHGVQKPQTPQRWAVVLEQRGKERRMSDKGIRRDLRKLVSAAEEEIRRNSDGDSIYPSGLAGEGWAGGYLQAICDVQSLLNGVNPNSRYAKVLED